MAGYLRSIALAVGMGLVSNASAQGLDTDPKRFESALLDLGSPLNISSYETPFAHGAMAVVVPGGGRFETYSLALCQDGTSVCAGTRVGTLSRENGMTVVRGLFGRTFYLEQGGSGIVERNGERRVLAWNARANGTAE